jgi:hypothetical protein
VTANPSRTGSPHDDLDLRASFVQQSCRLQGALTRPDYHYPFAGKLPDFASFIAMRCMRDRKISKFIGFSPKYSDSSGNHNLFGANHFSASQRELETLLIAINASYVSGV